MEGSAGRCLIFVGSLNRQEPHFQAAHGVGLSAFSFDDETGESELLAETRVIDNPTFLAVSADGSYIYANSEVSHWREGLVGAFRFDTSAGTFSYINTQPALGSTTTHVSLTRDGRFLLAANYSLGEDGPDQSVAVFGIREDGGLTPPVASAAHSGSTGPNAARQERSHAHSINQSVTGEIAVVADLGLDRLATYRISQGGALEPLFDFACVPGAGPRHVAFHPNGRFLFVMNELDATIASLSIDSTSGILALIGTTPAVPAEGRNGTLCADVQVSPDGRFLYGSNRGHDSIAVFSVDGNDGALSLVEYRPCGGATPRNLALSPSGDHLFSANQDADVITVFKRDLGSGRLTDIGRPIRVGTPMCVRVIQADNKG